MKYIAYGSNMAQDQMARRCPDARLIGTGYLEHTKLEFYLHATVERSQAKDARVPVAVWEISKADEERLDIYEGFPSYYIKAQRKVRMMDGSEIRGMIYLMNYLRMSPPASEYYDGIETAYMKLGFEEDIEKVLMPALDRSWQRKKQMSKR